MEIKPFLLICISSIKILYSLFKHFWKWIKEKCSNEFFLIHGIIITSFFAVFLSIALAYTSDKIYISDQTAIWEKIYAERWLAKHDTLRVQQGANDRFSKISSILPPFIPSLNFDIEKTFIKQAFQYYLTMQGITIFPQDKLDKISASPNNYFDAIDKNVLDKANDIVNYNKFASNLWWVLYKRFFWALVIIQFFNAIMVALLYLNKKKKRSKRVKKKTPQLNIKQA